MTIPINVWSKAPKSIFGIVAFLHALLNISNIETLLCHPILGMSWEGFVIDNNLGQLPEHLDVFFYRTARGAELDLLIITPENKRIAFEIKAGLSPKLTRGFYEACQDPQPDERFVVYSGTAPPS